MNVYITETATRMACRGVAVEVFTRATRSQLPPVAELAPGVLVRHVAAGPFEGLGKDELPSQLCAFTAGVLRAEARRDPGHYGLIHSHYWLSGQVGWLARERWGVPLVHTAHTLAKVKNAALAEGDTPEPRLREIGEQQVVDEADLLVANTAVESGELISRYDADPGKVRTIAPGVDLVRFRPGDQVSARLSLGLPVDATIFAFIGRLQPLKAPDVLVRAAAELVDRGLIPREKLAVVIAGGPSGSGMGTPEALRNLAVHLGIDDVVRFLPPQQGDALVALYRAADAVAVPSHNESFGLVALEAQACGTPVVAAAVGGLPVAVRDGSSGLLVPGHDPVAWAGALNQVAAPQTRGRLARGAVRHAEDFSWERTTDALLACYAQAAVEFRRANLPAELVG